MVKSNSRSGEKGSAVKIDSFLLEKIEETIKREENRFKFSNKKQFIDIAVHEFLKKFERSRKPTIHKNGK